MLAFNLIFYLFVHSFFYYFIFHLNCKSFFPKPNSFSVLGDFTSYLDYALYESIDPFEPSYFLNSFFDFSTDFSIDFFHMLVKANISKKLHLDFLDIFISSVFLLSPKLRIQYKVMKHGKCGCG